MFAEGHLKPDYQILGADTGRCTSKKTNIMGIPKQLRPMVKARNGYGIVECDYSQMEVGVLAALSGDHKLLEDYNSGDVYQKFADKLAIERSEAKQLFLAVLYGVGKSTLVAWLNMEKTSVDNVLTQFSQSYKRAMAYLDEQAALGERMGYVSTTTGLRRRINRRAVRASSDQKPLLIWQRHWLRNFSIQANAAVVFKKSLIDLAENIQFSEFKLLVPHYDAIVFEAPLPQLSHYTDVVVASMKRAMTDIFPSLKPHVKVSDSDPSCWNAGPDVQRYDEWIKTISNEVRKGVASV